MFTGNISTRPFYNERLVTLLIALGAVAGLALTAFNVQTIMTLTTERSRHKVVEDQHRAEAAAIDAAASQLQQTIAQPEFMTLAAGTYEANNLIDQRTFSWTVFFGLVEDTLPRDVRLIAVAPRIERGVFSISMIINAKRQGDIADFIDALLTTGAFRDILPAAQQANEDGSISATLSAAYLAPGQSKAGADATKGQQP
jgi:hypothetical protein